MVESEQQVGVQEEDVGSTHTDAEEVEVEAYIQLQQQELELNEELEEVRKNAEAEEILIPKDAQIEQLLKQLQCKKERYGQVWRMNCEHDAVLA